MNGPDILQALGVIGSTSKRTAKEALVATHLADPLFKKVLQATYDPFTTYGITPDNMGGKGKLDIGDESVWKLLGDLASRRATGNAARYETNVTMAGLDAASAEILFRILTKDLRAGFTEGTINRVAPGTIRVFEVMLSHKYEPKRIKKFPVMVEPKLDGLRAICLVANGEAKFYSRTGKEFVALAHLGPSVVAWMDKIVGLLMVKVEVYSGVHKSSNLNRIDFLNWFGPSVMSGNRAGMTIALEGEVLTGDFASTTGDVRRKSETAENAQYHVFDIVPYDTMTTATTKSWAVPFARRVSFLNECSVHLRPESPIKRLLGKLADSHEDIDAIYDEFQSTKLSDFLGVEGFGETMLEGAIVKPLDGHYEKKRSHAWLKMKAQETEDLKVVGAFEGEGKYAGKLGGLIVKRSFKNGVVPVRVGGGFSDELRETLWSQYTADQKFVQVDEFTLLGRLIEVEFHEETPDGSLRHPRFVRFRDDKAVRAV